jgi:hypothetical protein
MKANGFFIVLAGTAILFAAGCKTSPEAKPESQNISGIPAEDNDVLFIDSANIQDYVCVVNLGYHPNIDRFVHNRILELMETGDPEKDYQAYALENWRRG